jgi:rhodanese-related sulfurtransferase
MHISRIAILFLVCALGSYSACNIAEAGQENSVQLARESVFAKPGSGVPEVSTEELEQILKDQSAVVLDTRPYLEWSVSHIPGALNVAPKPGVPMALYTSDVAEIGRLVGGDKSQPLVLYCNGPYCGKSKRVAGELLEAGYKNVRRYQLGAPVWRASQKALDMYPGTIRLLFGLMFVTHQCFRKVASPAQGIYLKVRCSPARMWGKSLRQRMTAGSPWKITTPASLSSA